jgi:hypothetical protein
MDPYLVRRWSNVHVLMMGIMAGALKRVLPPGLEARPEEHVRIEAVAGERMTGFKADVAVIDARRFSAAQATGSASAVAEPILVEFHRGPIVVRNIEIVDVKDGDRVITAIEVLSPWNKLAGRLNRDYRRKLQAYEDGGANWVEIDLLRSPRRRLDLTWDDLPVERRGAYLVVVKESGDDRLKAYPIGLRERLPTINIPLREDDRPVPLDLQWVLERVYEEGPFESLDYSRPPDPPLDPADAEWAAQLVAAGRGA